MSISLLTRERGEREGETNTTEELGMEPSSSFSSSSSSASEALVKTLVSRGWCFGDVEQVEAVILIQSALHGGSLTVDLVESELANTDLRSIGGKSLPDPALLRNSSHLQGPKVLQISSVRDISRSSIADTSGNSNNRRLLRLSLTDGHSEITAIEYSHIPSIVDDVVPGTKVRLENKVTVRSGIVCLNPKVITVLGGVVQSLYEEWQMNRKYSGFSRSSLKTSKESDTGGPPPFEKLQIGAISRQGPQGRFSQNSGSTSANFGPAVLAKEGISESRKIHGLHNSDSKADGMDNNAKSNFGPTVLAKDGISESRNLNRRQNSDSKADDMDNNAKSASSTEKSEEKASSSEARPKEAVEAVPVQNQAAAQKLLQKMNQSNRGGRHSRGQSQRGRGKQEDTPVFTLDEWERRQAGPNVFRRDELPTVSQDEDLARQLQNQFDMEDHQIQRGPRDSDAENIKMSMFSFQRDDAGPHDRAGFRGRGRGRARGRGRGRG